MSNRIKSILYVLLIGIGIFCSFLPVGLQVYYAWEDSKILSSYDAKIDEMDSELLVFERNQGIEYNRCLFESRKYGICNKKSFASAYGEVLNTDKLDIMAKIKIPKIDLQLPIYHDVNEDVLSKGIGHLPTSSLPIGGQNTRTILMGHRDAYQNNFFTRLDELKKGDLIYIDVLNQKNCYKISRISVIRPEEVEEISIEEGEDLLTLITCTPYGINTHRLVIDAKRVAYDSNEEKKIKKKIPSFRELFIKITPLIWTLIVVQMVWKRYRRKKIE